jgi:hypothetical protein
MTNIGWLPGYGNEPKEDVVEKARKAAEKEIAAMEKEGELIKEKKDAILQIYNANYKAKSLLMEAETSRILNISETILTFIAEYNILMQQSMNIISMFNQENLKIDHKYYDLQKQINTDTIEFMTHKIPELINQLQFVDKDSPVYDDYKSGIQNNIKALFDSQKEQISHCRTKNTGVKVLSEFLRNFIIKQISLCCAGLYLPSYHLAGWMFFLFIYSHSHFPLTYLSMALSWNEIKERATHFSAEWADAFNEDAEAKTFLFEFFNVFGISQRKVSNFEHRVKKLDDHDGYIDLFWPQTILVEMKSRGKSLDRAYLQAREYLKAVRQEELPKYILVSDFEHFRLYDLEEDALMEFKLAELVHNVQHFGYLLGYQKKIYKEQDPANIRAAEVMGKIHDRLKEIGYTDHPLEVYLVRIFFCLFADDTTIFNKEQFQDYIVQRTNVDGSDLAAKLQELFQVLNTPVEKRYRNLDEQLSDFPYVNGKLFEELLPTASFDSKMRNALLDCCNIDWSKISPAIFGSMFQSVMNPTERRNIGAHYTSEKNILKLIKPLFLDDLWAEFESVKNSRNKLTEFHKKLSTLKIPRPCLRLRNFLVITYRELRLLEIEILRILHKTEQVLDVRDIIWIDVDQFYGIEIEEFPARIAEVAMWLIDHQMNMQISNEFGQYFVRLPLVKSATIVNGNALRIDWQSLLNPVNTIDIVAKHANIFMVKETSPVKYGTVNVKADTIKIYSGDEPVQYSQVKFDYILGNPPFVGKQEQNEPRRIRYGA